MLIATMWDLGIRGKGLVFVDAGDNAEVAQEVKVRAY